MIRRTLIVWLAVGVAGVPPAGAQTQVQHQEKAGASISMDLSEAYLEDVLKLLSKQSGINFVASDAVRNRQVTLYMDRVPIQDALETILKAYHLTIRPHEGKNLYVVTESGTPTVETVTKVFHLKYARVLPSAGEVLKTFGLSGTLIRPTLPSSTPSSGGSTSSTQTTGTSTQGGGTGGITGGSVGDVEDAGILPVIKALLTEHGSVVADARTNSIIATDVPERMEVIEATIARLDVRPKQIFIEAEVLEVTLDTLRRIGIEYGNATTGTFGTFHGPSRTTFFPFSRGLFDNPTLTRTLGTLSFTDADVLFKLLANEKDVKILARPRLMTLSGEVAEIRIVSEVVTGTTSTSQSTTGTVVSQPERAAVGTTLRVTPMVNDDRFITMVIEPEVSRVVVSTFNTSFQDANRRLARTTVMVPDSGTAMIAGLISSDNIQSVRKIPGLGDVPVLGAAFRRTENDREDTEILLFITPHLLPDEEARLPAALAKVREQSPVPTSQDRRAESRRKRHLKERAIAETIEGLSR